MNACGRMSPIATAAEVDAVVKRAAIAREALGPDRDMAVDCHGRFTPATARRVLPELTPFRPLFLEEPVLPEHNHALAPLVAASPVPLATGERIYGRAGFLPVLQAGMAVVQPDLSHAGGISEVTRIASLAETFGALLAPHCPLGPIALAASLQVGFATPNLLIQEQSLGIHYHKDANLLSYVMDTEPFRFVAGHAVRTGLPGLGITVDEDAVRAADRDAHQWRNPVWRHHDGSLAEW
jgi:galactonate dehydratase